MPEVEADARGDVGQRERCAHGRRRRAGAGRTANRAMRYRPPCSTISNVRSISPGSPLRTGSPPDAPYVVVRVVPWSVATTSGGPCPSPGSSRRRMRSGRTSGPRPSPPRDASMLLQRSASQLPSPRGSPGTVACAQCLGRDLEVGHEVARRSAARSSGRRAPARRGGDGDLDARAVSGGAASAASGRAGSPASTRSAPAAAAASAAPPARRGASPRREPSAAPAPHGPRPSGGAAVARRTRGRARRAARPCARTRSSTAPSGAPRGTRPRPRRPAGPRRSSGSSAGR